MRLIPAFSYTTWSVEAPHELWWTKAQGKRHYQQVINSDSSRGKRAWRLYIQRCRSREAPWPISPSKLGRSPYPIEPMHCD